MGASINALRRERDGSPRNAAQDVSRYAAGYSSTRGRKYAWTAYFLTGAEREIVASLKRPGGADGERIRIAVGRADALVLRAE
jgi:hypothetical protein